ncbi:hypothetical protein AURDEDRAFT_142579 [Auricularia subglabra TFB-10046 SS5]|nr:hypothetical protein AURDEDRAFT_142579 [Auricularia subglabra TFB-10046 SS5]
MVATARSRMYSTPVSPQDDLLTAKAQDAAPLASAPARKSRVELRPAPRPTQSVTQDTPAPLASAPAAPQPDSSRKPTSAPQSQSIATSQSFTQTIQEDFASAERLGIITPPPVDASRLKKFWHRGKELVKFYFRGAKLIVMNANTARALKKRVCAGGPPLTRAEWQLTRTSIDDIKRLVPFVLVLLLLEEALPLLVIYVPSLLPSTCVLPSQRHRMDLKRVQKQLQALEDGRDHLRRSAAESALSIQTLDAKSISTLCGLFSLSRFGPNVLLRHRLQLHLHYLAEDDRLLAKEFILTKSLAHLNEEQLQHAVAERGLIPKGMTAAQLRVKLESWIARTTSDTPLTLVIQEATASV